MYLEEIRVYEIRCICGRFTTTNIRHKSTYFETKMRRVVPNDMRKMMSESTMNWEFVFSRAMTRIGTPSTDSCRKKNTDAVIWKKRDIKHEKGSEIKKAYRAPVVEKEKEAYIFRFTEL